jgi:3-oxoacyl-[acyl-carrier protein] reductase
MKAMRKTLQDMRTAIDSRKHLCFFGLGSLLMDCFDQIVFSAGKEPDFLCDNAQGKWGTSFRGAPCISPSELAELDGDTAVIITVRNYESIHEQLKDMGIRDVFVACYDRSYRSIRVLKRIEGSFPDSSGSEAFTSPVRGKWTLITGASRGLGYRIALEMAGLGSNLIVHGRTLQHVKGIASSCSRFAVEVIPVAAELGDMGQVDAMLSLIERKAPVVDIVFNNAAISPPCPGGFWDMPGEDFLAGYRVNTLAPIRICQRLIPPMIGRGFGRIVCITSSIQKRPGEMAYACSKAALNKFIHDLAPSLEGTGVALSLADPGWLRTDMGGSDAPRPVVSAVPGVLLGALLGNDMNGRWIDAQDYTGMSLSAAIERTNFYYHQED